MADKKRRKALGPPVCSLCGSPVDISTVHLHQDKLIGDECCWDERLKSSE